MTVLQTDGLSHSEIRASRDICSYTRLIAAYHVLHRLCEPRHPPYALTYFRLKLPTYIYIIKIQRTRTSGSPYFKLYYLNLPKGKKRQQKFNFYFYKSQKLEFFITVLLVPTCQRSPVEKHPTSCRVQDWLRLSCSHPYVENNGFEPLTPCLQSRCSSQLS